MIKPFRKLNFQKALMAPPLICMRLLCKMQFFLLCTWKNVSSKHLSCTCRFGWSLIIGRHYRLWEFQVLRFDFPNHCIAHSNVKLLSHQKHVVFTQIAKSGYYSQDLHITTHISTCQQVVNMFMSRAEYVTRSDRPLAVVRVTPASSAECTTGQYWQRQWRC